ncbi:hypothetical protein HBI82_147620 [Parastagonospora nodorum]|nr:hypothetical protein HBI82_147620 [Parastagonospora nodorum]KAH6313730.1 hypothetical protein HBI39_048840 [Parastagonospora nodorum]KAH6523610.1 hypothetical protein HBI07_209690 [Parastagonospora nodorum]
MAALPHTKWDEGQRRARKTEQRLLIPTTMSNGQSRAARYSVALAQQHWQTVTRSAVSFATYHYQSYPRLRSTGVFFLDNFVRHGKIPHRALLRPWVDMLHFHGVLAWIATKIWLCGGIFSGGGRWSFLGVDNCLIPFDRFAG